MHTSGIIRFFANKCCSRLSAKHLINTLSLASLLFIFPIIALADVTICQKSAVASADDSNQRQSNMWGVRLLSNASKSEADKLVSSLAEHGFKAESALLLTSAGKAYQVSMSGFASLADAGACLRLIIRTTAVRESDTMVFLLQSTETEGPDRNAKVAINEKTVATEALKKPVAGNQSEGFSGPGKQNKLMVPKPQAAEQPISAIVADDGDAIDHAPAKELSLSQAIQFGLGHNIQYLEQVSQTPLMSLDIEAAADQFGIKSTVSTSSSQRVGSTLGQEYNMQVSKKFESGLNMGVGLGTARFGGESLTEARLSFSQPLLRGRGTLANTIGIEEAKLNRARHNSSVASGKQQLMLDVISSYFRAVLQKESIKIHEATIEQSSNMLQSSNAKFKFGMVSRMDVFRAEMQMLESKEALEIAQSAYQKTLDDLKMLIGMNLKEKISLVDPIQFHRVAISGEDELIRQALENRPELLHMEMEEEVIRKRVLVSRNNLKPQLDMTFQISQSGSGQTFSKSTKLKDTRLGIGISGSPDFSMASEQAQYRRQLLALEHARLKHHQLQEKIRSGIRQDVRLVAQGERNIGLREKKVEAAEKQKKYAVVRYQKGLVDNATVVEAEKSLVTARISYLQAIVDYKIALGSLYKNTGQLERWLERER
jgi:outer membrane protein TolC